MPRQAVQRTFPSKLSDMPGTQPNRVNAVGKQTHLIKASITTFKTGGFYVCVKPNFDKPEVRRGPTSCEEPLSHEQGSLGSRTWIRPTALLD